MRREKQYALDIQTILRHYFDRIYGKFKTASARVSLLSDSQWLEAFAKQAAQRMVTGTLAATARSWRAAAREGMLTPRLYTALQSELQTNVGTRYYQLIEENAKLISSLPAEVAKLAVMRAARREQEGERADGSFLLGYVTRAHAQLIARTETSKATTALTQARSEDLGLPWYVWQTSRDQRVRESHQFMQGVLVRWDDAPSPERLVGDRSYGAYAAGNIFNCRCYPEPLIRLTQVQWPHKTFYGGKVQIMTLAAFKRINNIQAAAAA